jgi:hypothetical protein
MNPSFMSVSVGAISADVSRQNQLGYTVAERQQCEQRRPLALQDPPKTPKKHTKLVGAVHDRQLSAAGVPAR